MKYIFENAVIDYKDGHIRRNGENIFETAFNDFDVCADDKGNLFTVCQNDSNGIFLISINGESISRKCLLESKTEEGYNKSFCCEYVNGWINAVYVIKHEDRYLLIHHIINSEINPFVVDTFDDDTKLFLFKDYDDNLYVVYNKEETGFKKYEWKTKKWSSFEKICDGKLLFASADFSEKERFVVSVKEEKGTTVFCGEKIISDLPEEVMPVVVCYGRETAVLFEYQGRILKSVKEEIFSRPKYAYFGTIAKYELVTIISDTYKTRTYASLTPRGTYRPLILTEPVKKEEIKQPEPMKEELSVEKKYDEIIKLLENKSEFEILSSIMKKLEEIERKVEEVKLGNTYQ